MTLSRSRSSAPPHALRADADLLGHLDHVAGFSCKRLERVFQRDLVHVRAAHAAQAQHLLVGIGRGDVVAHRALGQQQVARRVRSARRSGSSPRCCRRNRTPRRPPGCTPGGPGSPRPGTARGRRGCPPR